MLLGELVLRACNHTVHLASRAGLDATIAQHLRALVCMLSDRARHGPGVSPLTPPAPCAAGLLTMLARHPLSSPFRLGVAMAHVESIPTVSKFGEAYGHMGTQRGLRGTRHMMPQKRQLSTNSHARTMNVYMSAVGYTA